MSELIDRIFDVEKISAEVNNILAEIGKAVKGIDDYKMAIENLTTTTRKAKGFEDLAKSTKSLNDNVIAGGVEMKRYESEVEKLRQKTEQLTGAEKAAAIEIAKARLELAAATKATKEAAIADIEKQAALNDMSGSYNSLVLQLKVASREYKALSEAERNSAQGKEMLKKIQETQASLKATDAEMGNYQRNVGNYASALEGLSPKIGGLAGTLLDIAQSAVRARDELNEAGGANGIGIMARPQIPAGLATIMTGLRGIGQAAVAMGRAMLANPILAVVAGIVAIFGLMKKAIDSNGEATRKLGQVLAPFKVLLGSIMQVISGLVSGLLDGVLAFGSFLNSVMSLIPGLDKLAEKNREAIELEREKQRLIREGIADKAFDAKEELRIAELKKQIMEKDKFSSKERLAMAKEVDRAEKAMALDDAKRANDNLKNFLRNMKLMGKTQKDYTEDELRQLVDLQTAKYAEQQKYFDRTKKLASRAASLAEEIAADEQRLKDEAAAKEKERSDKFLAAQRRLRDSQLDMMKDSEEKSLLVSAEAFKRKIEDLKRNGELTKELLKNLTTIQENEQNSIRNEWDKNRKEESKKTNEELLAIELKRIEGIQKGIQNQTDLLSTEYKRQETFLKKELANNLITQEQYEKELTKLQLDSLLDVNNKQIASLQKLLTDSNLTDEKRAEFSKQLADLQIANDNAVADATIKNNNDKVKSDEDAKAKRLAVAQALGDATMQIFGAISDYAKEKSEQRISELEKELEASNTAFDEEQQNLDNSLMSDESRAQKQIEIDNKKAAAEKVINDKIQAEKIKQAKWDKANAIVQAIISAGLAVLNASQTKPFIPLGLIAAGLATTLGAIQIATIASQPIPAYEKGTDNHPGGLSLWGEKRAEVAVTPSGQAFLAEKPTISNFDAGTKIFKSVSDYENFIAKQSANQMTFDYDKFGEKMPQNNIILDGTGLWSIVNKQNARRKLINRRYSS
jgi:hypothetical protein